MLSFLLETEQSYIHSLQVLTKVRDYSYIVGMYLHVLLNVKDYSYVVGMYVYN